MQEIKVISLEILSLKEGQDVPLPCGALFLWHKELQPIN